MEIKVKGRPMDEHWLYETCSDCKAYYKFQVKEGLIVPSARGTVVQINCPDCGVVNAPLLSSRRMLSFEQEREDIWEEAMRIAGERELP